MDSISAFSTSPGLKGPATVMSNTANVAGNRGSGPAAGVFSTMRYNLGNSPVTNAVVTTSGPGASCNPMMFSGTASVNNTPMPPSSVMTVSAGSNAMTNNLSTNNNSSRNNSISYHVTYGHHHVSTPILHGVTGAAATVNSNSNISNNNNVTGSAGMPAISSSAAINPGAMMGYGVGNGMSSKGSNISKGSTDHNTSVTFSTNSGGASDVYHRSSLEEYNPATLDHWSRYGTVHMSGSTTTPTVDESSLKQVAHTLNLLQGISDGNHVPFWSKLVDPMLPIESAKEINRALASVSKLPQHSATAYACIASCITTPSHLHIVTLLDKPHRDGIRDVVLQDLLEQLSTEARQPLLDCAEMLAEMAKLSLIRLAGVVAMVEQFLGDPEKELAGLTILGRVAEHYYGTDTFRRAIRDIHAIEASLDRLYHSVEYEADVVMIRRMLCVRNTPATPAGGGGVYGSAAVAAIPAAAASAKSNTFISAGEVGGGCYGNNSNNNSSAAAAGGVYATTANQEEKRVTTLHPLCVLAHASGAQATCMHYSHARDEILSAHANGVIAVWGDPFDPDEDEEGDYAEVEGSNGCHHHHRNSVHCGIGREGTQTPRTREGEASSTTPHVTSAAAAYAVFSGHNGSFSGNGSTRSRTSMYAHSRDALDPKPREEIALQKGCVPVAMTGHTIPHEANGSRDAYYVAVACMSGARCSDGAKPAHAASTPYSMHMPTVSSAAANNIIREPVVSLLARSREDDAGSAVWSLQETIKRPSAVAVTALVSVSNSLLSIAESILDGSSSVSGYATSTGGVSTGSVLRHDISFFDVHTAQQVSNIACAHNDYVTVLRTCEKDACIVFSGSRDGTIRVWDTRAAAAVSDVTARNQFTDNTDRISNSSFSAAPTFSGTAAAVAGARGVNATSPGVSSNSNKSAEVMQPLFCLPCKHDDTISCISSFSNYVFTGSLDGTVQLWDLRRMDSPYRSRSFLAPVLDVVAAAFSSDCAQVAAVATARGLFLIDTQTMSAVDVLPHSVCTQLTTNDTGSLIFALYSDGIRVHSLT